MTKNVSFSFILILFVILNNNFVSAFSFFNADNQKNKAYRHKEEKKEFPFLQGGTLHIENETNDSTQDDPNSTANNTILMVYKNTGPLFQGTVTINGKTYRGNIVIVDNKVIIDGEESKILSSDIIVEGHDKELIELLTLTESNDGDLECVDSEINIDGKNAFIKTNYKTNDCQAHRSYTLKVPKKTFIKLLLAKQGSITAEDIDGSIEKVKTHAGNISLKNINGNASVQNSFGNNTADNIQGNVTMTNSSGDNTITHVKGAASSKTSFGDNQIANVEGDASIETSSGNNSVAHVKGNVTAKTSFGSNFVDNVEGKVRVNSSSGDNNLGSIQQEVEAKASFGDNTYRVGGKYPDATIKTQTIYGNSTSEIPVDGTKTKETMEGTIGKGGPIKILKTSSGNNNIKK